MTRVDLLRRLRNWWSLRYGRARRMCKHGAVPKPCPHCDRTTPVYRTANAVTGEPTAFSVCLWCDGLIEYGDAQERPREPYTAAQEISTNRSAR